MKQDPIRLQGPTYQTVNEAWENLFNSRLHEAYKAIHEEVGCDAAHQFAASYRNMFYTGAIAAFTMLDEGVDPAVVAKELTLFCCNNLQESSFAQTIVSDTPLC